MARKGNPILVRLDLNRSSDSSQFSKGEGHQVKRLIPFFLSLLLCSSVAVCFIRFLGSEVIGIYIVLFALHLLGLIFLLRFYRLCLKKQMGFRFVFLIYVFSLFFISFLFYFLRLYLVTHFSSCFCDAFAGSLISYIIIGGVDLNQNKEITQDDLWDELDKQAKE